MLISAEIKLRYSQAPLLKDQTTRKDQSQPQSDEDFGNATLRYGLVLTQGGIKPLSESIPSFLVLAASPTKLTILAPTRQRNPPERGSRFTPKQVG